MVILIAGTVAQKYLGLYLSQRIFFDSYLVWFKFIPFPGMRTLVLLMAMNLLCKLCLASPWSKKQAGVIVSHIGVLILLMGSGLTGYYSEDGKIVIAEGGSSNVVTDYHQREWLFFMKDKAGEKREIREAVKREDVKVGAKIGNDGVFAFSMKVLENYRNSSITEGEKGQYQLDKIADFTDDEANVWGVMVEFVEVEGKPIRFPLIEGREVTVRSLKNEADYVFVLRKKERKLPFSLYLEDFKKEIHPGTQKAKAYSSRVMVQHDDGESWHALIEMNQPLRYQGYTFFQSSFLVTDEGEKTVLAVVKNSGRIYPYVASIIICLGILWHLMMSAGRKRK